MELEKAKMMMINEDGRLLLSTFFTRGGCGLCMKITSTKGMSAWLICDKVIGSWHPILFHILWQASPLNSPWLQKESTPNPRK